MMKNKFMTSTKFSNEEMNLLNELLNHIDRQTLLNHSVWPITVIEKLIKHFSITVIGQTL